MRYWISMIPQHAPLYPEIPYEYSDYKRVSLYGRANEETIRDLLPDPLDYVSNYFEVFVLHAPNVKGLSSYHEGGVVVSAGYDDIKGAHMLCEYVNDDAAVAAGREYWGYPKKMATVTMTEQDDMIKGTISRKSDDIITLSFREQEIDLDPPQLFPRLQVKQIPSVDGTGYDVNQVVKMSFEGDSLDFDSDNIRQRITGNGDLEFETSETDPLYRLAPTEITGGTVTVGSFHLGSGEVLADLTRGE